MNDLTYRRLALSCLVALSTVACGGETVEPGNDSGPRDGGAEVDAPTGDDGGPGDSGTVDPDADVDGGPPPPAYCPTIASPGTAPSCPATPTVVELAPDADLELTGDQSWTCANTYHLRHTVFVMSGTLTIQAGTRIIGDNGAALVITQGARLEAVGHPDAPIVFTSSEDEGSRAAGDWGGLVLLGDAPINTSADGAPAGTNAIEGLPATDNRGRYGGTDAAHDCGTLSYARIEFAGFQFGSNNELNGLTMGGCGTATDIDHVQVHLGLDDGFEMFGGAPNLRFVIASGIDDDGLDWDLGYVGTIQYAVVDRLGLTATGSGDPNGIEADNHPNAFDNTPRSNPTVYNVTLVGEPAQAAGIGMVLRRGTHGAIANAIVLDWPRLAVNVRDTASIDAAGDQLSITNSLFFTNGASGTTHFAYGTDSSSTPEDDRIYDTVFDDAAAMNRLGTDPMLGEISDDAPSYVPPAASPAATGGATPPAGLQTQATFVGAFGPGCADWSAGWTAYPID